MNYKSNNLFKPRTKQLLIISTRKGRCGEKGEIKRCPTGFSFYKVQPMVIRGTSYQSSLKPTTDFSSMVGYDYIIESILKA